MLVCLLSEKPAAGWGRNSDPPLSSHAPWQEHPAPVFPQVAILQPLPVPCALQRYYIWLSSTWRRGSQMRKPFPSLTWKHQDTSVRTNGKRSRATVSWAPAESCACQLRAASGCEEEAGGPWRTAGSGGARVWQVNAERLERLTWWQRQGPEMGRELARLQRGAGLDSACPQVQKLPVKEEMALWPLPVLSSLEGLPPTPGS